MAVETGVYLYSGNDVGLLQTRPITIETGVYSLSGQTVGFSHLFRAILQTVPYVLTGIDFSGGLDRVFPLGAGSYVLTGGSIGRLVTSSGVDTLEDLLSFFDEDDFADRATWTHNNVELELVGLFDHAWSPTGGAASIDVTNAMAHFTCPAILVQGVRQGDELSVDGREFVIRELQPDGEGLMRLSLRSAA